MFLRLTNSIKLFVQSVLALELCLAVAIECQTTGDVLYTQVPCLSVAPRGARHGASMPLLAGVIGLVQEGWAEMGCSGLRFQVLAKHTARFGQIVDVHQHDM